MQHETSSEPEETNELKATNERENAFQSESQQISNPQAEPQDFQASELDELAADEPELAGLEAAFGNINQLTELGNQAIQQGLIVGHGYHGSQYEILCKGEIVTLDPQAATAFLQQLIRETE